MASRELISSEMHNMCWEDTDIENKNKCRQHKFISKNWQYCQMKKIFLKIQFERFYVQEYALFIKICLPKKNIKINTDRFASFRD